MCFTFATWTLIRAGVFKWIMTLHNHAYSKRKMKKTTKFILYTRSLSLSHTLILFLILHFQFIKLMYGCMCNAVCMYMKCMHAYISFSPNRRAASSTNLFLTVRTSTVSSSPPFIWKNMQNYWVDFLFSRTDIFHGYFDKYYSMWRKIKRIFYGLAGCNDHLNVNETGSFFVCLIQCNFID